MKTAVPKNVKIVDMKQKVGILGRTRFALESDSNIPGVRCVIGAFQYKPHAQLFLTALKHKLKCKQRTSKETVVYVLTGTEKTELGLCPLYEEIFSSVNEARSFASQYFFLREWFEIQQDEKWEIKAGSRTYRIEKRRIRNDLKS